MKPDLFPSSKKNFNQNTTCILAYINLKASIMEIECYFLCLDIWSHSRMQKHEAVGSRETNDLVARLWKKKIMQFSVFCCLQASIDILLRTQGWNVPLWFDLWWVIVNITYDQGWVCDLTPTWVGKCDMSLGLCCAGVELRGGGWRRGEGQVETCRADGPGAVKGVREA
jgi:hypothetical protein